MTHERIREMRRRNRISQAELALEFGKTQTWTMRLERGMLPADDTMLENLLSAIARIAARKAAIADATAEATARVNADFENLNLTQGDGR
jgi:transcriptional regulator with XRE-family HTH domain